MTTMYLDTETESIEVYQGVLVNFMQCCTGYKGVCLKGVYHNPGGTFIELVVTN